MTVSQFWVDKYVKECKKSWDLFYKRNGNRFFKDRHWVGREFIELHGTGELLELGCGVGNLVLPLVETHPHLIRYHAADISPEAVEILKVCHKECSGWKQHPTSATC